MIPAYEKSYLSDAQNTLGSMLDYGVNDCGQEIDLFFQQFLSSGIAERFGQGDPKFVGGMSGVELAREVFRRTSDLSPDDPATAAIDKSPEYWTGWVMAYYQWHSGLRFVDMSAYGLTAGQVRSMYLLHEADISKFVENADQIIQTGLQKSDPRLKEIRKARGYSQRELAEASGVSLRMIQLYEQRQNDINKAQAGTLFDLSRALGCQLQDLMEP